MARYILWIVLVFSFGLEAVVKLLDGDFRIAAVAFIAMVALAGICVWWETRKEAKAKQPRELQYLSREDEDLGSAVMVMGWRSAWGRCFAAQELANGPKSARDYREGEMMRVAASHIWQDLVDGKLEARGRKPGQLDFEAVPATHWRSTVLHMIPDKRSLWRLILIPTGGAEFTSDGTVIGHEQAATQRTDQMAIYDGFIVKAREVERLWPKRDKTLDRRRKKLLKEAKAGGAEADEIAGLSQD